MIGKIFMGKMLFRARNVLGSAPAAFGRDVSMGGLDVILSGHGAQAQPIGQDSLGKVGPYTGKATNQPKDGFDPTAPTAQDLSNDAELFMKEFEDGCCCGKSGVWTMGTTRCLLRSARPTALKLTSS